MDIKFFQHKITDTLKKYRFVILILIIGFAFMLLPAKKSNEISPANTVNASQESQPDICQQIEAILEQVDGAGKVRVMMSEAQGQETIYQIDEDYSEEENRKDIENRTVIVSNGNKEETALVRKKNPPKYLGVIVVCQGADQPSVRLSVVDAVSKITGLGADRISVLRMK